MTNNTQTQPMTSPNAEQQTNTAGTMIEQNTQILRIADITIPEGRRSLDENKVAALVNEIKRYGLLHPISVRQCGETYTLIAGQHRLQAYIDSELTEIECKVLACDDLEAELLEISENLVRNELDAIAIGDSALRWIEILEKIGERAKQGDNRYTDRGAVGAPLKTTDDIADEIGVSERVLQENMQLAKGLIPEAKEIVRIKEVPKKIALKLSRLTPEQQQKVIKKRKITLSTLKEFLPSSTEEQGTEQRKRDSVDTGNVTKPCNIQPKSPPSDSGTTAESSNSRQESIPVNESANANPASKPSELVEVDLSKDDFFNALNGFRQAVKYADDVPALFEKASQLADVKYKKEMLKELLDTTYSSFTSIAEQLRKQFGAELKAKSKETTQKDKK